MKTLFATVWEIKLHKTKNKNFENKIFQAIKLSATFIASQQILSYAYFCVIGFFTFHFTFKKVFNEIFDEFLYLKKIDIVSGRSSSLLSYCFIANTFYQIILSCVTILY